MSTLEVLELGQVEYRQAWEMQRDIADARRLGTRDDTLVLLEHPPVYTLGRETDPSHISAGEEYLRALGADVVDVDRGGSVTFHGPGQMVGYPILDLASVLPIPSEKSRGDVLRYLRVLEEALIDTCARFKIEARRRPPFTGVWVDQGKLAAIGVKLGRGGITLHGVALNVTTDLAWFGHVIPCGIQREGVASLASLGVRDTGVEEVGEVFAGHLARRLGLTLRLRETASTALPA